MEANHDKNQAISLASHGTKKQKYHGLLKRSPVKNFRDDCFRFIDYVSTTASSSAQFISILRVVIVIQFFVQVFSFPSQVLWDHNSPALRFFNIISVVAYLCPPLCSQSTFNIFSFILSGILFIHFTLFVIAFSIFRINSKAPKWLIEFFSLFLNATNPWFLFTLISYFGRSLGSIINSRSENLGSNIATLILSAIFFSITLAIYLFFSIPSLAFRPLTFDILTVKEGVIFGGGLLLCLMFVSLLTQLSGMIVAFLRMALGVCFVLLFLEAFFKLHLWTTLKSASMFYTCLPLHALILIILSVFEICHEKANEILVLCISLLAFVGYVYRSYILERILSRALSLAEELDNDPTLISEYEHKKGKALLVLRVAFENGLPNAHNWKLFHEAFQIFGNDYELIHIFARYAAIYPKETKMLHFAGEKVYHQKHGSFEFKFLLFQITSGIQQRDNSMSAHIQKSLTKIQKSIDKVRNQVRYFWECLIRGNLEEIDDLVQKIRVLERDIILDFNHLSLVYPSNPFIAKAFSRYLSEIIQDEDQAQEQYQIFKILRTGSRIRTERYFFYGMHYCLNLPNEEQHGFLVEKPASVIHDQNLSMNRSRNSISSFAPSSFIDTFNAEALNEEKFQRRYIRTMAHSVYLPSFRVLFIVFIFVAILLPTLAIVQFCTSKKDLNSLKLSSELSQYVPNILVYTLMTAIYQFQYMFGQVAKAIDDEEYFSFETLKEYWERTLSFEPLPEGWETDLSALQNSEYFLRYYSNALTECVSKISLESDRFQRTHEYVFGNHLELCTYLDNQSYTCRDCSLQYLATAFVTVSVTMNSGYKDRSYFDFWTCQRIIEANFKWQEQAGGAILQDIFDYIDYVKKKYIIIPIVFSAAGFIIATFATFFFFYRIHRENNIIYSCLLSLPKASVSKIVQSLGKDGPAANQQKNAQQQAEPTPFLKTIPNPNNPTDPNDPNYNSENPDSTNPSGFGEFDMYEDDDDDDDMFFRRDGAADITYQEENALKVLSTAVTTNEAVKQRLLIVSLLVFFLFIFLFILALTYLIQIKHICAQFTRADSLFFEIPKIHCIICGMIIQILRMGHFGSFPNYPKPPPTPGPNATPTPTPEPTPTPHPLMIPASHFDYYTESFITLNRFITRFADYAKAIRSGSEAFNSTGIGTSSPSTIDRLTKSPCTSSEEFDSTPESEYQIYECVSYESSMISIVHVITAMKRDCSNLAVAHDLNDPRIGLAITWTAAISLEDFVRPSMEDLQEELVSMIDHTVNSFLLTTTIICILFEFFFIIELLIQMIKGSQNSVWSLQLLMFCDSKSVLQSKQIAKILSNDFSEDDDKSHNKDANDSKDSKAVVKKKKSKGLFSSSKSTEGADKLPFYASVVSEMPDGALFLSNTFEILSVNRAAGSILGVEPEKLLGQQIFDIFTPAEGKDSGLKSFTLAAKAASRGIRSPFIEYEMEVVKADTKEITCIQVTMLAITVVGEVQKKAVSFEGIAAITITIQEMNSVKAQRNLLEKERENSQHLLTMILPLSIAERIQNGEKNISFTVKSVSVMFIDIVSFTPWCGSLPADVVMRTLNRLYLEYDRIIAKYDHLMKIKLIGDCYMLAGGVFDVINIPQIHAKQGLMFGLDLIKAVEILDIELSQTIQIRLGMNTGGPVVAGVLGTAKPTFDILGPTISMAEVMEHYGVSMTIRIPQPTYDLISDQGFAIRQLPKTEYKGKPLQCYLVYGYN